MAVFAYPLFKNRSANMCLPSKNGSRDVVRWAAVPRLVSDDVHSKPSTALLQDREQLDDVGTP